METEGVVVRSASRGKGRTAMRSDRRSGRLRGLVGAMLRRVDIGRLRVSRGEGGPLSIGRIDVGDASVDEIDVADLSAVVQTGQVRLDDVRALVGLRFRVDWRVRLPFVRDPRGDFPFDFGDIPFDFESIDVPELDDLNIAVPAATIADAMATVQPVTQLTFNGGAIDELELREMRLPAEGYAIAGFGFDRFDLSHVGLPDATVGELSVGRLRPDGPLELPGIELSNLELPEVDVPNASSRQPIVVSNALAIGERRSLIDVGILTVGIRIEPTLTLFINALALDSIRAVSRIGRVRLRDIRFPIDVRDVQLRDVRLSDVRAEAISL